MTIPAYLAPEALLPRMKVRTAQPFLARPDLYTVIDGDTLRLRTPPCPVEGVRKEAFRIRLPNVDTPELRKEALFDGVVRAGGFDPFRDGPGELARDRVRHWCRGRVIMVAPLADETGSPSHDRYGRLLAEIVVSGRPGRLFDIDGAWSLEWALMRAGLAQVMPGRPSPLCIPPALGALLIETGLTADADIHRQMPSPEL